MRLAYKEDGSTVFLSSLTEEDVKTGEYFYELGSTATRKRLITAKQRADLIFAENDDNSPCLEIAFQGDSLDPSDFTHRLSTGFYTIDNGAFEHCKNRGYNI